MFLEDTERDETLSYPPFSLSSNMLKYFKTPTYNRRIKALKDRLYKLMYSLEEIIEQIEDNKNVLNQTNYYEADQETLRSILNVQKRLLDSIEADSRELHDDIDKTILDLVHNRI